MTQTTKSRVWGFVLALALLFTGNAAIAQTYYVASTGFPWNDGLSAATPKDPAALSGLLAGNPDEIRILDNISLTANVQYSGQQTVILRNTGAGATITTGAFGFVIGGVGSTIEVYNVGFDVNGMPGFEIQSGATLDISNGNIDNFNLLKVSAGGYLNNNGTIDTGAAEAWATGDVMDRNVVIVDNAAGMVDGGGLFGNLLFDTTPVTITGDAVRNFAAGSRVQINTDLTLAPNSDIEFLSDGNGAYDVIVSGGANVITGANTVKFGPDANVTLENAGNLNFDTGVLDIDGNVNFISGGWMQLSGTFNLTGDFSARAGAWFDPVGTGIATIGGDYLNESTTPQPQYVNPIVLIDGEASTTVSSTAPFTTLTIDASAAKTVTSASNISAATFNVEADAAFVSDATHTFAATTLANIDGSFTKEGAGSVAFAVTDNDGAITHNGSGPFAFNGNTVNDGDITINSGTATFANLDNNAGGTVVNNGGTATIAAFAGNNEGLISTTDGTTTTSVAFTNAGDVAVSGGTFISTGNVTNAAAGTLNRTGGLFTVQGNLTNAGAITDAAALAAAYAGTHNATFSAAVVAAANTDGIVVNGNFTNNNAYVGNVIMAPAAGNTTVTGGAKFGHLTIRNAANQAVLGGNINVGHLILASGQFNLASYDVTVQGAADAANGVPAAGVYTGANGNWTNGSVVASGNRVAVGQATSAHVNGSFEVAANSQVQLVSNAWLGNLDLAAGATVQPEFDGVCYVLTVAGSTTGDGTVLGCGVFTITSNATSIRAQLIAAGINPDVVNVSVEIALGNGDVINLTDPGAEGSAPVTAWKGVTLANTQRNFILKNGSVNLNDANLTLRGGFIYSDTETNGSSAVRTTITNNANIESKGYLVFANNTASGTVPQANFRFTNDGVNQLADDFYVQRLKVDRREGAELNIVDANESGNPSTVVVTERLEILNNTTVNANDNNIRYIGGNLGPNTSNAFDGRRRVTVASNNVSGTGYFDLGNNWISAADPNWITVNGALNSGSYALNMQFRQTGTAGQRDLTSTINTLSRIHTIGNEGVSYMSAGSLSAPDLTTVNDFDFFLEGPSYLRVAAGVTFNGNLHLAANTPGYGVATSRFETTLPANGAARTTLVKGDFRTNVAVGTTGTGAAKVDGVYLGVNNLLNPHNLEVHGNLDFLDHTPFFVPRKARLVVGGTGAKAEINAPAGIYVQRLTINRPNGADLNGTLDVNDLYLQKGVLTTDGNLKMRDLAAVVAELDGGNDASYDNALASQNYSIVTRERLAGEVGGQLSRGTSAAGAYTSDVWPGAPYTVQYIGTRGVDTGDEIPYLNLIDHSKLNRLVMNVANGVEVELSKDLTILTRLETLSGNFDLGVSEFAVSNGVQWVHGHATVTMTEGNLVYPTGNGTYDLMYVSKENHTTGYEFHASKVRNLTINTNAADIVVSLDNNHAIQGDFRHIYGTVDLGASTLSVANNHIHNGANALRSTGAFPSVPNGDFNGRVAKFFPDNTEFAVYYTMKNGDDGKATLVDTNGTIKYTKTGYTLGYVQGATEAAKHIHFPNVVVADGTRTFELDEYFYSTTDVDVTPNSWNLRSFTQEKGATVIRSFYSHAPNSGAETAVAASGDEVGMVDATERRVQNWNVVNDATVITGNFYAYGANILIGGNYTQGVAGDKEAVFYASAGVGPKDLWNNGAEAGYGPGEPLLRRLNMQVMGNFTVAEDEAATVQLPDATNEGNRFFLSNGHLKVAGNYSFFGHGDRTMTINHGDRGLRGIVEFNRDRTAATLQDVRHVQSPRAYFQHVVVNGRGIALQGNNGASTGGTDYPTVNADHAVVNNLGTVTFSLGNIVTGANREVVVLNTAKDYLSGNEIHSGSIRLSGSNSFVEGNMRRYMSQGGTTGGMVEDGYVFPLGSTFDADGEQAFSSDDAVARHYRPLTLQFPANIGQTISAVANTTGFDGNVAIDPALKVQGRGGNALFPGEFYTIDLTERAPINWNVKFRELPGLEPNIRLGVQGLLGNQNGNIDDMRIVTPVSGTEYRMAGVYDLTVGGPDDTFNPNDFIDGIPTFIQEGPGLIAQQYDPNKGIDLTIATNGLSNPFEGPGALAYLQLINNVAGSNVDVAINGTVVASGFGYQSATRYLVVPAETALAIEIRQAGTANVIQSATTAPLAADASVIAIAQGGANGKAAEVKVVAGRQVANNASAVELLFNHGVTNGGAFTVQRVSNDAHRGHEQTFAINAAYGSVTSYQSYANPSWTTIQIRSNSDVAGQYLFDLSGYAGQAITLVGTGEVGSTANPLMIYGFDAAGNRIEPQVTTSDNEDVVDVPVEFTLYSNYPNPFNPTTNIRFDLPEQANVRIDVVDATGRQVMTVAPQAMTSGANKVVTLDASRLASGVYFYRVIAEGASKTHILGSKFTLVK